MLKPLANIKAPDLISFNRQSYVDEIIERIKMNEDWSEIWNDELFQNADQMIMQFFAYMVEKNAMNFNLNIKEKFLAHAYSDEAIYQNLSDAGIDVQQATNAQVDVVVSLSDNIIREPLVFEKFHTIPGVNINNSTILFEIIEKDANGKYNYLDNVIINTEYLAIENFTLTLYAGKTQYEEFELSEYILENMQLKLSKNNIEHGSIRVYYNDPDSKLVELNQVDILNHTGLKNTIFPKGTPSFKIKYDKNNYPILMFGTEEFGGCFYENHVNGKIIVFYRQAYGSASNILAGGINFSETLTILDKSITAKYYNRQPAAGGKDIEDLQIAKYYGPLRLGRNGVLIDEKDIKIKLKDIVVKHEVKTPIMSDNNGVPFMHALHYIVPKRNFDNFEFKDFAANDTIVTYKQKIINQITEYCAIQGAHDQPVIDEFVTDFVYPDSSGKINFTYTLKNLNPLSNSLRATAYDDNGQILDYCRWEGNYILDKKISSAEHDKVTRVRTKTFAALNIINNSTNNDTGINNNINNKLYIEFDDYGHIFYLTLPTGVRTYKELATIINDLIINEIKGQYSTAYDNDTRGAVTNMLHLINHVFVSYETVNSTLQTGRLIFNSTKTGRKSKIVFHDYNIENTNKELDLYYQLGVGPYVYRPGRETGWVFNDAMIYNYETNQIFFDIYSDNISKQQIISYDVYSDNLVQSIIEKSGPVLQFVLTIENNIKEKLLINDKINVFAEKYNDITKTYDIVSHIVFTNIAANNLNIATLGEYDPRVENTSAQSVFNSDSELTKYDYNNALLSIQVVDGIEQPYYVSKFGEINKIVIKEVNIINNGQSFTDVVDGLNKVFYPQGNEWRQEVNNITGPKFTLNLSGLGLSENKNYKVSFIYIDSNLLEHEMDYIVFANINLASDHIPYSYYNTAVTNKAVVNRALGSSTLGTYLDANAAILHIAFSDGEEDLSLKTYLPGWVPFDRIRIEYKSKNFSYITVSYIPNRYMPEGEAKAILDVVKDSASRLIGLENITQQLTYIPFGLSIMLKVDKKYSLYEAVNAVKQLLYLNYQYDNYNSDHTVNTKPNIQTIKNLINTIAFKYGITDIEIDNSLTEYVDKTYNEPCYYFILDETTLGKLYALEEASSNMNIKTISEFYKIAINAVFSD